MTGQIERAQPSIAGQQGRGRLPSGAVATPDTLISEARGRHPVGQTLKYPLPAPLAVVGPVLDASPAGASSLPIDDTGRLALSWAAGRRLSGYCNAGDALGAIVTAAIARIPVAHTNARSTARRLATIGTIAQTFSGGTVQLWGTGLDRGINIAARGQPWAPQPDTRYMVHALRGPDSGAAFQRQGIDVPGVWGDPGYLAPRLWPEAGSEKTHDLGIVLHLSELESRGPAAGPDPALMRYSLPDVWQGRIRLISMEAPASVAGVAGKVAEIVSCRRILTTSLHGLVLADAYGVPAAWFGFAGRGGALAALADPAVGLDHRFRDLFAGMGRDCAPVFLTPRDEETDWAAALDFLETVAPTGFDADPLLAAFPGGAGVPACAAPLPWPDPQPYLQEL